MRHGQGNPIIVCVLHVACVYTVRWLSYRGICTLSGYILVGLRRVDEGTVVGGSSQNTAMLPRHILSTVCTEAYASLYLVWGSKWLNIMPA